MPVVNNPTPDKSKMTYIDPNFGIPVQTNGPKPISDAMVINNSTPYGSDNVNNPYHYTQGSIECIDAIKSSMSKEAFKGFLKGNAIKYLWRYEKKGKPIEDLKKCEWYLNKLIDQLEDECNQ